MQCYTRPLSGTGLLTHAPRVAFGGTAIFAGQYCADWQLALRNVWATQNLTICSNGPAHDIMMCWPLASSSC